MLSTNSKRYEDASLVSVGINTQEGEDVGLVDTVLSANEHSAEVESLTAACCAPDACRNRIQTPKSIFRSGGCVTRHLPLMEIFNYPDFVPIDVVFAVQGVTPIGQDR